jgi:hypothetical protein
MNRVCIVVKAGFSMTLVSPALKAPLTIGRSEGPDEASLPPEVSVIQSKAFFIISDALDK